MGRRVASALFATWVLLPAVAARAVIAHTAADVHFAPDTPALTAVYATYSSHGSAKGTMALANPIDGCGKLEPQHNRILLMVLRQNSSCTSMEQALNAQAAGAVAAINVAEGAGEGYIWIMRETARDAALRLGRPGIPHLCVSHASGATLLAEAENGPTVQIVTRNQHSHDTAGGTDATLVLSCLALLVGVIVLPFAVLRLLCRQPARDRPVDRELVLRRTTVALSTDNDANCAVCLEQLGGKRVRTLACSHAFHVECVDAWLLGQPTPTCPLCRGAAC